MSDMMVRKQIYLPRRQNQLLKRLAKQRGVSEAEVIRQALDGFDLFDGGDVVFLPPCCQHQNLLEALVLAVRETQDGDTLVLAGQVAGDLRQA